MMNDTFTLDAQATAHMREALKQARRGQGRVEPNPMVGAVLVRNGRVVAKGHHRKFGGPHAEVDALRVARAGGVAPSTCDMYITLEPCTHHGKTPPCVDALIDARPQRIIIAMRDPNPLVEGKGIAKLRDAGIETHVGLCESDAQAQSAPYIKRTTRGLPWVIAKWAQTVDGRIATRTGDSQWISSPASRRVVHQLRARVDASMVGAGTVIADNPQLTARDVPIKRVARRVVVDPNLRTPAHAAVFQPLAGSQSTQNQTIIAVTHDTSEHHTNDGNRSQLPHIELLPLPHDRSHPARLVLTPLLKYLVSEYDATNLLVEGGATLLGEMFRQQLVDQAIVFVAAKLLGDENALPAVRGLTFDTIASVPAMQLRATKRIGDDVMLDYRVPRPG